MQQKYVPRFKLTLFHFRMEEDYKSPTAIFSDVKRGKSASYVYTAPHYFHSLREQTTHTFSEL